MNKVVLLEVVTSIIAAQRYSTARFRKPAQPGRLQVDSDLIPVFSGAIFRKQRSQEEQVTQVELPVQPSVDSVHCNITYRQE